MKKIAIIGAGPAGSTAAYYLSKHQKKHSFQIDIYEPSPYVGGMAATIELWQQKADLGPHRFFSYDPIVNQLWDECVDGKFAYVKRKTRIYYKGKFFHYPLQASDIVTKLNPIETTEALFSYLVQKIKPSQDLDTFDSWVIHQFGKKLYKTFFKTYTEKLWGIPCHELDADFAKQRIKKFSLSEAIKSILFPSTKKRHKTLAEKFKYPLQGSGQVYEFMINYALHHGANFYPFKVKKIETHNHQATGIFTEKGDFIPYDHVISSMPITDLINAIDDIPTEIKRLASKLRFRNTILVYLLIDNNHLFDDQWIYVHDERLLCGRITNFRNWVPTLYGGNPYTILAMEYWCFDEDKIWLANDEELIQLASTEIVKTNLVQFSQILDGKVIRLAKSYPVYFAGYKKILASIKDYFQFIDNLQLIGRYGSYKYNNQDHSILMGIKAAENIIYNARHDLWNINTDYDTYLEGEIKT
ncbi:MAG: NAD(P)-binding protein [Bacteroidales bacterium]|nr:NAD(P)-binding protein [Bacteroidales bacterium]